MRKRSSANEESVALGEDAVKDAVKEDKFGNFVDSLKNLFKKKEEKPPEEMKGISGDLGLN